MPHSVNPLVSVTAGEWAPELSSRIDLPNYRKACRRLRNMIPTKQGGATRRPGTVFIANGKGEDKGHATVPAVSRLEKFQFAPGTTFILEFCDKGVRFYSNGQQVMQFDATLWVAGTIYGMGNFVKSPADNQVYYALYENPTSSITDPSADFTNWRQQNIYEVPSPYSGTNFTAPNYWDADVFVLQTKQVNDVVYVVHPRFPVYKLIRHTDVIWTMELVQFLTPAMLDQNVTDIWMGVTATTGSIVMDGNAPAWATATYYQPNNAVNQGLLYKCVKAHTSTVFAADLALGYWQAVIMFYPEHVGSYWLLSWNRPLSFVELAITVNGSSASLDIIGSWSLQTYGTWDADLVVEASYDNEVNWQKILSVSSRSDANYNIPGNDINGAKYRVTVSNWTSVVSTVPPRAVITANNQFVYGLVQATGYISQYQIAAQVIVPLYSTNTTTFWSEGAWSEVRGYPQAITIFQERMWYAATQFQPQRVWGTQTDDLENFALVDQSQSAYGLAFDLNAPGRGPIQWLNAQTDLFAGLAGAEWVISSGQPNVAITPTQVIALEHSVNGSAPHLPGIIIGNACFYLQRKGCSFQQMLFSVFTNKYMSSDMQVLAQHLTAPRVKQFDYQQQFQNQSLLWAVCGDGSLIALTYAMDQEVFGWSKHLTGEQIITAGNSFGAVVINGETYTILTIGDTDFTLFGAPENRVGITFVADISGPSPEGSGTLLYKPDFGFLSVQVIYGADGQDDEVWVAVQRKGANHSTIERINPRDWQTEAQGKPNLLDAVFADCATVVTSPSSEMISGLPDVLNNRTGLVASITPASGYGAWSIGDLTQQGSTNPPNTVTIPNYVPQPGDVVVVGLPAQWYVQPMPLDVDGRLGPIPGITKAIRKLFVRTVNSLGGGWATAQGDFIPFQWNRGNQNPSLPPALIAYLPVEQEIDVGALMEYAEDPQFTIQGTDALPFTLLGIIVIYDAGGNP